MNQLPTRRQRQAVYLAQAGLTHREIAKIMKVRTGTASGFLSRAYATLGTSNRKEAVSKLKKLELEEKLTPIKPKLPTLRQCEAIHLAGQGLKNQEIAIQMGISGSAISSYLVRAFETLDVHTRQEAFRKLQELEELS